MFFSVTDTANVRDCTYFSVAIAQFLKSVLLSHNFIYYLSRTMVFLSLILALLIPTALSYDAAYDRVDANKVLADDTLFRSYIDCFLDRKPCTAEFSEEFKSMYYFSNGH